MEDISWAPALVLRLAVIFVPATVAGIALRRLAASRSRNRLLYLAAAGLAGGLAFEALSAALLGARLEPSVALAALATPIGWGLIAWTARSPRTEAYRDQVDRRGGAAVPVAARETTVRPLTDRGGDPSPGKAHQMPAPQTARRIPKGGTRRPGGVTDPTLPFIPARAAADGARRF